MEKLIHKYKINGQNIVVDVCSGGIHLVDDTAYKMLGLISPPLQDSCPDFLYNNFSDIKEETIKECYDQLYDLYKQGVLFSPDDYNKFVKLSDNTPLKALCLHVSHDCNLRCKYCFAETGDFGNGRTLMSIETAVKAIDFLIKNSKSRKFLEVDFFGGEPLMAWETVKATVDYARGLEKLHDKIFRFTVTTNGILLNDEIIEYINNEMSNVVLSLDGRKEINDTMRPTENGKGSYDIIFPKFKKLVDNRKKEGRTDYYIRGTFTANNLDFTNDILHIAGEGFRNISIEPMVSKEDTPFALKTSDLPKINDEYTKLFDIMKNGTNFNFFHFNIDLEQGPCVIKRLRGCGAGNEYVAITPDGEIYPCHQFAGSCEWLMGNLNQQDELNPKIKEYFASTNVYTKEDCPNCWARFYCSGGCSAADYLYEGNARKPQKIACELMKKRIESAIALKIIKFTNFF